MHPRKAPPQGIEGMQECIQECIRARTPVGPTMQNASESARGDGAPRPSSCAPTRAQPNAPDAVSGRTARPLHAAQAPAPGSTRRVRRARDCRAALALSKPPFRSSSASRRLTHRPRPLLGLPARDSAPIPTYTPDACRSPSSTTPSAAYGTPLPPSPTGKRIRRSQMRGSDHRLSGAIAGEGQRSQLEGSNRWRRGAITFRGER